MIWSRLVNISAVVKENSVILDNCIVDYLSAVGWPVTLSDSRKCGSRYDSRRYDSRSSSSSSSRNSRNDSRRDLTD